MAKLRGDGVLTTADLNADPNLRKALEKKLGKKIRNQRTVTFTKEQVRQHAIRVLAEVSELSQDQRDRVLRHAIEMNQT